MQKLKLNPQLFETVSSLIKTQCCNCYEENCLLLDDGEAERIPLLHWFSGRPSRFSDKRKGFRFPTGLAVDCGFGLDDLRSSDALLLSCSDAEVGQDRASGVD